MEGIKVRTITITKAVSYQRFGVFDSDLAYIKSLMELVGRKRNARFFISIVINTAYQNRDVILQGLPPTLVMRAYNMYASPRGNVVLINAGDRTVRKLRELANIAFILIANIYTNAIKRATIMMNDPRLGLVFAAVVFEHLVRTGWRNASYVRYEGNGDGQGK